MKTPSLRLDWSAKVAARDEGKKTKRNQKLKL
jgi:hypothetical protein